MAIKHTDFVFLVLFTNIHIVPLQGVGRPVGSLHYLCIGLLSVWAYV